MAGWPRAAEDLRRKGLKQGAQAKGLGGLILPQFAPITDGYYYRHMRFFQIAGSPGTDDIT